MVREAQGVRTPGFVQLKVDAMVGIDRHLVREVFVVLWRRMGWPVQQMGFAEWDCLAGMTMLAADSGILSADGTGAKKRVFPGRVVVDATGVKLGCSG